MGPLPLGASSRGESWSTASEGPVLGTHDLALFVAGYHSNSIVWKPGARPGILVVVAGVRSNLYHACAYR
jgi:hypothetical protein